ncbi:MAG: SDR family NAD(P)-dependent oxidoreductase [Solirubrobacterales bacterium]|nr:SDR family NAD(P)-dependent oxidoreductase [Solirubrobacterales bacterium]
MEILPGTRVLVTGASRGIGRALAVDFAARGATVGLFARGRDELEALAEELPGNHFALPCDIGDRDAVGAAVASFVSQAGGLDILIANAGIAHYGPFMDVALEHAEEMVRINVLGTIYTVRAGLEHMLGRAQGHVVVVSSGAGLRSFPWAAVYGATKAADRMFAEALRHELSGTGVDLTTVYPGEIKTDLHAHEQDRLPDWYRPKDAVPAAEMSAAIIKGIEGNKREVFHPPLVRLLRIAHGISPKFGDRVLRVLRGGNAAPRVD